ncbi:16S rRNA (cytosine(967)-C(5))-methyltransferase [Moraxella caviae]|uniref:16S rRNA (Cytosine(967)-C(5))-methyltransferase n=1 Tax=Moraxella caviae TaxID=34060 RepID=A0A1S9ZXI9_9GAMM|nr:transcription antitermination factor NusB [Moraxella caviae]OOR88170.1 16S rRNA (cytosine(967)-C(5))-methyltransferase [Moraxella caviae]STZ10524.1 Ribosomal RNA small subunit methyltransferase B [Moraxella caviae]
MTYQERLRQNISTRAKIIAVLTLVQSGQSLSALLDGLLSAVPAQDKGFAHELTLGTLRQWWALCRVSESLVEGEIDDVVLSALNVGLYQLLYLQTPDYATIFATVEALKELGEPRAGGLVNAILRKVAKTPAKFAKKVQKNHSLPNWLAKTLKQDWAEYYDALGQTLRTSAPIFVRANVSKISHDEYKNLLINQGFEFDEVAIDTQVFDKEYTTQAFKIHQGNVQNLPKFDDGFVAVQDLHAQISAAIIDGVMARLSKNSLQLLDACTAPAGKLTHWLAHLQAFHVKHGDYQMTAIDSDEKRLVRVFDNVERLGFGELLGKNLTIKTADATTFTSDKPFDVVVLDAPCTATGVIRRHPDIALLRSELDVIQTADLQEKILENLWQSVADGGYLLYITCSILKQENEAQLEKFLAKHADAAEIKLDGDWGIAQTIGRQILPVLNGGDGFYYALLHKRS